MKFLTRDMSLINGARVDSGLLLLGAILFHPQLLVMTRVPVVAHGLLFFAVLIRFAVVVSRWRGGDKFIWVGGYSFFVLFTAFNGLGIVYSLMGNVPTDVRLKYLTSFLLMPLIWWSLSEVVYDDGKRRKLVGYVRFFVFIELFIMLLQLSRVYFGYGLPGSDVYDSMIPGSQYNSNNAAAIVVGLVIFYSRVVSDDATINRVFFYCAAFGVILLSGSRLGIILFFLCMATMLTLKNALVIVLFSFVFYFVLTNSAGFVSGNPVLSNIAYKLSTFETMLGGVTEVDSSTSARTASYEIFIENLPRLGLGTNEILNYSKFTSIGEFADEAIFSNPHSMLIEFGYWMGWLGLVSIVVLFLFMYLRPSVSMREGVGLILAMIVVSSMPSSAIPLFGLWLVLLMVGMIPTLKRLQ